MKFERTAYTDTLTCNKLLILKYFLNKHNLVSIERVEYNTIE